MWNHHFYGAAVPIILGVLASLLIGVSDTFGRASARRANAISHVSTQMLIGVVVTLPLTFLLRNTFLWADAASGAISGILVASGLAIVYRAMAVSSAAIVSPTAAVLAALIPLTWDLISGTRLGTLAAVGSIVAIVSLAFTTFNPDLGDRVIRGLALALVGGAFFGLSVVFAADTSADSGAWPAVTQRATGFIAMASLAYRQKVPVFLPRPVRRFGIWGGVAGGLGMVCWIIGGQQGDLGTVSVISSTYPAVVVLLSTRFDQDQMRWWQALGIAGAIMGTALIALG